MMKEWEEGRGWGEKRKVRCTGTGMLRAYSTMLSGLHERKEGGRERRGRSGARSMLTVPMFGGEVVFQF
jgi:hypothetical protein